MQLSKTSPKIIISGGGTGGHIYPAIAIADEIKRRLPDAQILFVGAEGKMEMEKVPKAGYSIKGLPILGINRSNLLSNFKFPFKLQKSLRLAKQIIKEFQPDVAIGTGGYASGPLLWQAAGNNVPIVIQEQNSFPGITNKLLKNKASAICVAYEGIEQFPKEKTHQTGNPIRAELFQNLSERHEAIQSFGLDSNKKVILSIGGSQGSRTLNNAWKADIEKLQKEDVQLIWQTGKLEYEKINKELSSTLDGIHITEFIYDMKIAFAAADIIVSRAGAMAISELSLVGKPTVLVPFPYAAEDHQTKNAMALVNKNAAIMFTDEQVPEQLVNSTLDLLEDELKQKELAGNLKKIGKPNATSDIVDLIFKQIK
ncbi:MAG: undecaprenyldiphospho-muramoylpentapeptide beta-N-acetylglucosaminyltransferase [Moheibacter sp.]